LPSYLADISFLQLALIAAMALVAAIVGGVAGYGTGALMPLVLVPIVGAEPVVPILAISALTNNFSRSLAFRTFIDLRRALIVLAAALPGCVLGAWLYTLLTSFGALLVIGTMLIVSVPARRLLFRQNLRIGEGGLGAGAATYGVFAGGTTGAGVMLLSLLMASGLEGAAVVATDALVSIAIGLTKVSVFGISGAVTPQVLALGLLMGCVAFPGAFLAKRFVAALPVRMHTAILDAMVVIGGATMLLSAFRRYYS
jgi:uncharacterized membrane protein YfcA